MLILNPPDLIDFAGGYSEWVRKSEELAAEKSAEASAKPKAKEKATPSGPSRETGRKKDNPYARPFGRLTLDELEREITDTEIAIAECQESFGDSEAFRDPGRGQRLQTEFQTLSQKLEALEAEYFAREA